MHTIFETDAFILKTHPSGEANKVLELFTRDFGFIRANAQGLRQYRSKLRYSLTDFSRIRVSLVRGKEFWRITTASKIEIPYQVDDKNLNTENPILVQIKPTILRIFALLRRLLQGEDPHLELFDLIEEAFSALQKSVEGAPLHSSIEELTVLRILFLLGYVRDEPNVHIFLETMSLNEDLLIQAQQLRPYIIIEINRALKASDL